MSNQHIEWLVIVWIVRDKVRSDSIPLALFLTGWIVLSWTHTGKHTQTQSLSCSCQGDRHTRALTQEDWDCFSPSTPRSSRDGSCRTAVLTRPRALNHNYHPTISAAWTAFWGQKHPKAQTIRHICLEWWIISGSVRKSSRRFHGGQ